MAILQYKSYKKLISSNQYKSLALLYGDEVYLLDYCVGLIRKKIIDSNSALFNDETFTTDNFTVQALSETVASYPVFAEKKLIYLNNVQLFKKTTDEQAVLSELFLSLPPYVVLLIREDTAPDKRLKLYKTIQKTGDEVEFSFAEPSDQKAFVTRKLGDVGLSISTEDAYYLLELAGPSLTNLQTQIDKLAVYVGPRTKITRADMDTMIEKPLSDRVFDMIDALLEGRTDRAYAIIRDLKLLGEAPEMLIPLIGGQFCETVKAAYYMEDGVRDVKAAIGGNQWAAGKKMAMAKKIPLARLERGVHLARCADEAVKRDSRGGWDALWEMVLTLSS